MKQLKAVVVGYGNRGEIYAEYAVIHPDRLKIVAVCDPNPYKREQAKKEQNLSDDCLFEYFADYLKSGIECDFVINATMDQDHFETAKEILSAKMDMLMEKPIVPNKEELLCLKDLADKNNCKVFVGHVLRYTPFFKKVKELVNDGVIGDILTVEMNEHVGIEHYITSYVRGRWRSEKESTSGFLLAKSCHDIDLMCWLNNASKPERVASMGGRHLFVPENKPKDATEFCYTCPHENDCLYSAKRLYLKMNVLSFLTWGKLNKPEEEITEEEKKQMLTYDIYGHCAYDIEDADIVDRQTILVDFANGSKGTFTLVGGSSDESRYLHIVGTKGEIEGKVGEEKFRLVRANKDWWPNREEVNVQTTFTAKSKKYGHFGGDYAIMDDLWKYLNGDKSSVSITSLDDSVAGHLCVYSAEESRKTGKIVNVY